MTVVVIVCVAMLAVGAALSIYRIERGPTMLDRTAGVDVLSTTIVGAVALGMVRSGREDTLPILVALALIGFVTSVTVARFMADDAPGGPAVGEPGATSGEPASGQTALGTPTASGEVASDEPAASDNTDASAGNEVGA